MGMGAVTRVSWKNRNAATVSPIPAKNVMTGIRLTAIPALLPAREISYARSAPVAASRNAAEPDVRRSPAILQARTKGVSRGASVRTGMAKVMSRISVTYRVSGGRSLPGRQNSAERV